MSTPNPHSDAPLADGGPAAGEPTVRARARRRSKQRRRLANVVGLLTALVLTGGLYSVFAPAQAADDTTESAAEAAGRELYERSCITCHGENLEGVPERGPSLIGVGEAAVYFQVHTGRMPLVRQEADAQAKPPVFSDEEIDQLMAYVQANGGGPTLPSGDLRDGDLAEGGELFRANCAACHSATGAGGALSYGRAAPALDEATPTQLGSAVRVGPGQMPRFGPEALSEEDVDSVAAYVEHLDGADDRGGVALGRLGPIPEGFLVWIAGMGSLLLVCFAIGKRVDTVDSREAE